MRINIFLLILTLVGIISCSEDKPIDPPKPYFPISSQGNEALSPSMVWNEKEKELAIVWHESRDGRIDVFFSRFDADGNRKGLEVKVTDDHNTQAKYPKLTLGPNGEYGVVWQDYRSGTWEIYFNRLDKTGKPMMNDKMVTNKGGNSNPSQYPSVIYTDSEYAMVWEDFRNSNNNNEECEIYFIRLDSNGNSVTDGQKEIKLVNAFPATDNPVIIYDKSNKEFVISWQGSTRFSSKKNIYLARIKRDGTVLDSPPLKVNDDPGDAYYPSMVGLTNGSYAIAWHDTKEKDAKIFFTTIKKQKEISSSSANRKALVADDDIKITDNANGSIFTSLIYTGKSFGLSWIDNTDGSAKIKFQELNRDGTTRGKDQPIAPDVKSKLKMDNNKFDLNKPSLAWTNELNSYYIAWADNREGNYRVYISRPIRKKSNI